MGALEGVRPFALWWQVHVLVGWTLGSFAQALRLFRWRQAAQGF